MMPNYFFFMQSSCDSPDTETDNHALASHNNFLVRKLMPRVSERWHDSRLSLKDSQSNKEGADILSQTK